LLDLRDRALARGLSTETSLRLPLTQSDLADTLGISPVHTNRMVMKLQGDGLIRLRNEWLEILDQPRLAPSHNGRQRRFTPHRSLSRRQVPSSGRRSGS